MPRTPSIAKRPKEPASFSIVLDRGVMASEGCTLRVTNRLGLHAHPATLITRIANECDATIRILHGDRQADARSLPELVALEAACGARITLECDGPDARDAMGRIAALFGEGFGEED